MRGATGHDRQAILFDCISIRAPHAGCDGADLENWQASFISIRAPHAGCDAATLTALLIGGYFNPRTPCGVRLQLSDSKNTFSHFNPRTPCGVRP